MTASIKYEGDLRCSATHLQSGTVIETDAPTDNRGKGEKFSPTDTVCVALGTCMLTTMAIKARDMNIELRDATVDVTKHMINDPRRIKQIDVLLKFPPGLQIDDNEKNILQTVADNCPVAKSIHPDVVLNTKYDYN